MPVLERQLPAAAPDTTTPAIEDILAALGAVVTDDDTVVDASAADPEPATDEAETPALRDTAGHGPIRLRGRPVGPARAS
jgi:hypothetical protein